MIAILSPAKSLDFEKQFDLESSKIRFRAETLELVEVLQKKDEEDLKSLMSISDQLAQLNVERFHNFKKSTPKHAKQAVLAFQGDVYQGMEAEGFSGTDFEFAQKHVRILSGLYGLLRPMDLIQPYRLEMGTKLKFNGNTNLYDFWEDKITDLLIKDLKAQKDNILINLASNEYFKSVKKPKLKKDFRLVDIDFRDQKNGQYKVISFFAKKARGMMAKYIVKNQLSSVEELKSFDQDGYYYDAENSKENKLVFKRDE